ncbi:MAG: hypothetical protein WCG05_01220 [Alphaproteobacteria bacterium]
MKIFILLLIGLFGYLSETQAYPRGNCYYGKCNGPFGNPYSQYSPYQNSPYATTNNSTNYSAYLTTAKQVFNENHPNCFRGNCRTYRGFMSCLETPLTSPYAKFANKPVLVSTPASFNAFQAFRTKHPNCYRNFCNEVCSEFSDEYLEKKNAGGLKNLFSKKFDQTVYERRVETMGKLCSKKTPDADQLRFMCGLCTAYITHENTLIPNCEDKGRKIEPIYYAHPFKNGIINRGPQKYPYQYSAKSPSQISAKTTTTFEDDADQKHSVIRKKLKKAEPADEDEAEEDENEEEEE